MDTRCWLQQMPEHIALPHPKVTLVKVTSNQVQNYWCSNSTSKQVILCVLKLEIQLRHWQHEIKTKKLQRTDIPKQYIGDIYPRAFSTNDKPYSYALCILPKSVSKSRSLVDLACCRYPVSTENTATFER